VNRYYWSYRRANLFGFLLAITLLGVLLAVAMEIYPSYLRMARLTETAMAAYDLRTQMQIGYLWHGNWRDTITHLPFNDGFGNYFDSMIIADHGSFSFKLISNDPVLDGETLSFSLGRLDSEQGFELYIWRCGESAFPQGYTVAEPLETSLSPWYTQTLCRK